VYVSVGVVSAGGVYVSVGVVSAGGVLFDVSVLSVGVLLFDVDVSAGGVLLFVDVDVSVGDVLVFDEVDVSVFDEVDVSVFDDEVLVSLVGVLPPSRVARVFRANAGLVYNPNMSTAKTVHAKVRSTPERSRRCTPRGPARALEGSKLVPPYLLCGNHKEGPQSPPLQPPLNMVS
jgi:hypothetical protein